MITVEEYNDICQLVLKYGKQLHTYRAKHKQCITSADDRSTIMDFNFTLIKVFHGCFNRALVIYLPTGTEIYYSSWGDEAFDAHECSEESEAIFRDLLTLKEDI